MKRICLGACAALALCGCSVKNDSLAKNAQAACLPVGADGRLLAPKTTAEEVNAEGRPERSVTEAFHRAVRTNDLETVRRLAEADRRLLAEGSPWNDPLKGMTPLYSAIDAGNLAMVKRLVSCGAETQGELAIGRAAILVDGAALESIGAQPPPADRDSKGNKPDPGWLWRARLKEVINGQRFGVENRIAILRYLLEHGANPNAIAPDSGTLPLISAVVHASDGQGAELLLKHGADPNARNWSGNSAAHAAAVVGNVGALRALGAWHADLELKSANDRTALMIASALGDVDIVQTLLEMGASIRARTKDGWTAFFIAADERRDEVFKVLAAKGPERADFEAPRMSVLCLGCIEGSRSVVEAALACGADKEFADAEGFTPLLCAVENGHLEIVRLLLAQGANPRARTKSGFSALDLAAGTGNLELVEIILAQGLDVDAANSDRLGCPLGCAARRGYVHVVRRLLEKGAKVDLANRRWQPLHVVAAGPKSLREINQHARAATSSLPTGTEDDYLAIAELLLARGADVNSKTEGGESPLSVSLRLGFHRLADLLIAKGAALDARSDSGQTLLHLACAGGNKKVAELLLARGADLEARDNDGATPLLSAVDFGRPAQVEMLLGRRARLDAKTKLGCSALHLAAQGRQGYSDPPPPDADYAAVAELLLRHGADIRAVLASRGAQPLHIAAVHGNTAVARVLLERGAPVDDRDNYDQTPLFIAVEGGRADLVKLLIGRGANPKLRALGGVTALHAAAGSGNLELLQLFLSLGLDVNADGSEPGYTPLCDAALFGWPHIVSALIERGAHVNPVTSEPPLLKAAAGPLFMRLFLKVRLPDSPPVRIGTEFEYLSAARLLIAHGATVNVVSKYGDTPLLLALRTGFHDMADLLIERGAELQASSGARCTPLHAACSGGNLKVAKLLLSKGADVAALDADGFSPLHTAADNGCPELIELLLAHGAKLGAMVYDGRTALHLAAQGRQDDRDDMVQPRADADYAAAAEALIRHGADVQAVIGHHRGEQPLHTAAQFGNTAVARVLLDHGASVDALDADGNTPLTYAILLKKQAVAKFLVARRANVNRVTKDGLTMLELARGKGLSELAALLQENRAREPAQTSAEDSAHKGPAQPPLAERKAESAEDAEKALAFAERNFGADAPGTVVYLCRVAEAYAVKGQPALAASFYRRSLSIVEKTPGSGPPELAAILQKLAAVYRQTGFMEKEAAELEKRAASIKEARARPAQGE